MAVGEGLNVSSLELKCPPHPVTPRPGTTSPESMLNETMSPRPPPLPPVKLYLKLCPSFPVYHPLLSQFPVKNQLIVQVVDVHKKLSQSNSLWLLKKKQRTVVCSFLLEKS